MSVEPESPQLGITSEEFEIYQKQFIKERDEKYALLEKVRRLEQENARLSVEKPDKEFDVKIFRDKLQKPLHSLLSRTKRDSEVESNIQQENEALQKRLHSQEEDFQRQNFLLMQELQIAITKNEELEKRFKSLVNVGSEGNVSKVAELENEIRILLSELSAYRKPIPPSASMGDGQADDNSQSLVADLQFRIAAATEEKSLLREQMESERLTAQKNLDELEKTVTNLKTDLQAKQSTVQLLLEERDQIQRTFNERLNAVLTEKENLRLVCKSELDKVRQENFTMRQTVEEEKVMARARVEDIERQMKDLLEQIDVTGQQTKRDTDELLSEHKRQIADLTENVENITAENNSFRTEAKNREEVLKHLNEEVMRLTTGEAELSKLADKRKATIDDLSIHLDNLKRQHEEEIHQKKQEIARASEPFRLKLELASAEASKVPNLTAEVESLRKEATELRDQQRRWQEQVAEVKLGCANEIAALKTDLKTVTDDLNGLRTDSSEKITSLTEALRAMTEERNSLATRLDTENSSLQRQIGDKAEELKIVERKNTAVVRDLQKQLQAEKKRLEKVQNRLSEVLRDGNVRVKSVSEDSADFTERDETGSVSSWSFVSSKSGHKKRASDVQSELSNTETETGLASTMTDQEIRDLLNRITKLQQEKAVLIERVTMLETGHATLAEELLSKSAVINRFLQTVSTSGSGQQPKEQEVFSLRNVVERLGKEKSNDMETQNLRHLLEETLTKNIHLQKNMELLTEELDRLRGSSP
ncbi:GRIP1-associated protein 1-like [Paramacrobiotus metropolitanus]|uniref:GRIP1-associated protein 1-like n=1 Tax=Paramacrobiotus metropolitanus TaxID=2943436 RepID=UPI0024461330|nr:GRIP1-associated protein 1-like [Paramacrobiotus metropolitanus]